MGEMSIVSNTAQKRLLMLLPTLAAGGAERVTVHLANYWARKGWTVRVVTIADAESDFYRLDSRVERVGLALSAESTSITNGLLQNLSRIRAIRRQIVSFEPEFAIAMMTVSNILLALATVGRSKMCTIGSERVHPPQVPLGFAWEAARRYCYRFLDCVVALAPDSAKWIEKNTNARVVRIVGNPVVYPLPNQDQTAESSRSAMQLVAGRQIMLAIGRLVPQKGFDLLIRAFATCATQFPNWDLVILGEGPERSALVQQAADAGLTLRISFPGVATNVSAWLTKSDLFVLSSRFEGFPNTLLEAMACGLPVVSFDCETGPNMLIRNDTNGILVPAGDIKTFAAAIERLMGDACLRAKLGSAATNVRDEYSIESVARKWESLFEEAAA
jgi:glycosyltransferase involved in cell wall biosynthesis